MDKISTILKTLGHPERLRILALLSRGELTVSELTTILGLSQPRVTQYINSLEVAGIIERLKEGSWVFSRIRRGNEAVSALVATTLSALPADDPVLNADIRRLSEVREARAQTANAFFARVANDHDKLGDEYLPQADIEAAMRAIVDGDFEYLVDLGTGTGRVLEVFADRVTRGSGIDNNTDMLKVARHNIAAHERHHLSVRQGDLFASPLATDVADLVTLHQVLHYLDEPLGAIREAARLLRSHGQLIIVDFQTHTYDAFREEYAHRRLGFSDADIRDWMSEMNIELTDIDLIRTEDGRPDVKIWCGTRLAQNQGYGT